ncbi:MAG TPA: DegT/DnrJ/EryC1/StrS family aminotransferase [Blastocatellia bacterium]
MVQPSKIAIPFGDLKRQYVSIRDEIDSACRRVLEKGWFVLGDEVAAFESEFARYLGASHSVGVGSGTEALHLALLALGAAPGGEVIIPANTCVPTASAISVAGCTPVLVDVDPKTFNIDPARVKEAITARTCAIIPVHLYGQSADLDPILEIAEQHRVRVIEDVAQGHGSTYKGRKLGTFGAAGCFSFYPSKNLGAYGDGGAVVVADEELSARLKSLRSYGENGRYFHSRKGVNSRLDELQAAILRVKLRHLDEWNDRRRKIAARYNSEIVNPMISKPAPCRYGAENYHLYVIRCRWRDDLKEHLAVLGIGTLIHYPVPIHLQEAYKELGKGRGDYAAAEACADEVLSLPMFPELSETEISHIVESVNSFAPET